jgi:nucleotide-binding universal stress UspA family protein
VAYRRIVLATDGSPSAETAEHIAATLARSVKGKVIIAHAFQDPARAQAATARAVEIAQREGVKTTVVGSPDEPDRAIIEIADREDADLIVMGSRGLFQEEQLIGNIARKVSVRAPCDLLLTRARPEQARPHGTVPYQHMLIATDGSATADRAARKGYALATRLGARVTLLFVGHPKTGDLVLQDTVATMAEDAGAETTISIVEGDAGDEIVRAAGKDAVDLVVVGNRGLAGAKAALLGSVPKQVSEYAPVDVLIARTITQNLSEIESGEGGIVTVGDHKVAVYRDKKGSVQALSAKCTHMGCTVKWNSAERTWDCPCHGSRFDPTGKVVNGPAERPLAPTDL